MFKIARREESSRESIGEDLKSSESKTCKKRKKLKIKNKKWRRWRSARRGSAEKKKKLGTREKHMDTRVILDKTWTFCWKMKSKTGIFL